MDLLEAIKSRRAVRTYTAKPVDAASLTALIDAAIEAPSAMNQQPWSFVVVRDRALLDRISMESKKHMLRTTPAGLAPQHFRDTLENSSFDIFYHAPALILIVGLADDVWTTIDCSLAAQNLMLAARAAGLGSCWIGFAQGWLATSAGKAALGLTPEQVAIAPIIIGHPVDEPAHTRRQPPRIRWIDG
jgi:nitroreductase